MKIAVHIDFGELPMGPHATTLATEHYLHMWKEAEHALMCGRSGQNTSYRSFRHPQSGTGKESWSLLSDEDHQSLRLTNQMEEKLRSSIGPRCSHRAHVVPQNRYIKDLICVSHNIVDLIWREDQGSHVKVSSVRQDGMRRGLRHKPGTSGAM